MNVSFSLIALCYFVFDSNERALFPFPSISLKHEFYGLTSGFTRLIMNIKYVCHAPINPHVNFHDNRTN